MILWKKIPHLNYFSSGTFLIASVIYLVSFLTAYADSGNNLNTTDNNSYLQNETIPQMPNGTSFSNVKCNSGLGHVLMIGQFHNGDIGYRVIFLRMSIFDKHGSLLGGGNGYIFDVKPHETKSFDAITRFNGNFSSCGIQIDNAIPK